MKRIVKNARLWSTTERVVIKKMRLDYCILLSIVRPFYIESDAEIFPVHYTRKVAEKGFKMAFMMKKTCND